MTEASERYERFDGDAVDTADPIPFEATTGGRRRRKRRNLPGCLAVLVALAIVAGGLYFAVTRGIAVIEDQFSSAEDYPGPGSGEVTFQVVEGDSIAAMGRNLKEQGVVASVDAFTEAAAANPDAQGIQVGYYPLLKEMSSSDVVDVLVDPANIVSAAVTIPEGSRVRDIVTAIVKATDFKKQQITSLLAKPAEIGLPAEADGNIEGYLYPATYDVTPDTTPQSLLTEMVAKTTEVEQSLGVEAGAAARGLTPHEIITVASILEYEANNADDYAKVATVIYNRLDDDMALQMDSTVSYVSKREGDVWTTAEERESDSLYNTYQHTGLPPGPIGSPGEASILAALNPAEGNWLYFVPDFESGTTLFTDSYSQHLANVEKAKEFCRASDEC